MEGCGRGEHKPAATAGAPHAAIIAGPGFRTGGDVTAPWAATVAVNAAMAARSDDRMVSY